MKVLRVIGNVLWCITFGLGLFLSEIAAFVLSIVTIIPIFFGIPWVHLNIAKYVLLPFGKKVETHFLQAPIRNVLTLVFGGFMSAVMTIVLAVLFCITIIGIPVGKILFNTAKFEAAPFHAIVVKK